MSTYSTEDVSEGLARILERRLGNGHSVRIPELGVFAPKHQASEIRRDSSEQIHITPPKALVTFESDQ